MDRTRYEKPPRWWGPRLRPGWVRIWRPFRRWMLKSVQRIERVDIDGLDTLRSALADGCGVLITPNHSGHADALTLYEAADRAGCPFYFMAGWQVLGLVNPIRRMILRQHGCFSVDRDGADLRAFRQAVDILQTRRCPLVVFPEGEVYHINERVTPFREGPARMALAAARRADRPIVCLPCGIRYRYIEDPTPALLDVMERLERSVFWRPTPQLPLDERIYRFAEGMLALKELEYLGQTRAGSIPERTRMLADQILRRMEARYRIESPQRSIPERVKQLRQTIIEQREDPACADEERHQHRIDLDDLFFVIQTFSYPGDYVAERPTIERMAETLDKFEEDVLGAPTATIRAAREARVVFGEPIRVPADRSTSATELTRQLESAVQSLIDETARSTAAAVAAFDASE